jgi:hypothetical protein
VKCDVKKLFTALALISILLLGDSHLDSAEVNAQSDPLNDILAHMSVADRVGQLFVITFWGNDVTQNTTMKVRLNRSLN